MSSVEAVSKYKNIPKEISTKLAAGANVFYGKAYYHSTVECTSGNTLYYVYDDTFIAVFKCRKRAVFKYGTLVSEPYALSGERDIDQQRIFLNEAVKLLKTKGVMWIDTAASAILMTYPDNSNVIKFGNYVLDLTLTEEELWKKVHSKHRNVIRNAVKNEVMIESGSSDKLIDDYAAIDISTNDRSGRSHRSRDFFALQMNSMKPDIALYMAYKETVPQAGAIFYYNQKMTYYIYGATADHPQTGADNLLMWKAILDFKKAGVEKLCFVGCRLNVDPGSKYEGIQRFKGRFGGDLVEGYMFRQINNPLMYKLFKFMMSGYVNHFKSPYQDIIDTEIHKWAELN